MPAPSTSVLFDGTTVTGLSNDPFHASSTAFTVSGGVFVPHTYSEMWDTSPTWSGDGEAYCTITTIGTGTAAGAGAYAGVLQQPSATVSTADGYQIGYLWGASPKIEVYRYTNSAATTIISVGITALSAGDAIWLLVQAGTIYAYYRRSGTWTLASSVADSTYDFSGGGAVAEWAIYDPNNVCRIDNLGGGQVVASGTTLSPSGITHSRAQGSPAVSPGIKPSGLAHSRAQGSAAVSPGVKPSGLAHTRTQGALAVSPQLRPSGLSHTRTVGSPAVNPKPSPASLARTRALGSITVSPQAKPSGLSHTRALGSPTIGIGSIRALGTLTVTVAWIPRPAGLTRTRALGVPTARGRITVTTSGLSHTRIQGTPTLSGRALPAGLTRTRSLGSPSVNPRTAAPTGLSRTRTLGTTVVTITWLPRPAGIAHSRAQGTLVIRGRQTITTPGLSRTRAQGVPQLSARATPTGIAHSRSLGTIEVNLVTLTPAALSRA